MSLLLDKESFDYSLMELVSSEFSIDERDPDFEITHP